MAEEDPPARRPRVPADPAPPSYKVRGFVAGSLLGQGSYGKVYNVRLAARSFHTMVLKQCVWHKPASVFMPMPDVTEVATLVHLQRDLRVAVAPTLRDVWIGQGTTCLTMDKGLCLHSCRAEYWRHPEAAAAAARGLLHCLCLLHAAGVAHQDVKAANAVARVQGGGGGPVDGVRLVDFGAASTAALGCLGTAVFGTGCSLPPEALVADAGTWVDPFPGDVWAAARIVLGMFLGPDHRGALPFLTEVPPEASWTGYALRVWRTFGVPTPPSELCQGRLFERQEGWAPPRRDLRQVLADAGVARMVPEDVQDLLQGMLVLEPSGRTTAAGVAAHPFLAPCGTAAAAVHVATVAVPATAVALHEGGATDVCPVRRARAFGALLAAGRKTVPRRVSSARVWGGAGGGLAGGAGAGGAGVGAADPPPTLDATALVWVVALPVLQAYLRREAGPEALEWDPASVAGAVFGLCASFLHIRASHAVAAEDAALAARILNTTATGMPSLTAAANLGLPVRVLQTVGARVGARAGGGGPTPTPPEAPPRARDMDCLLCEGVWPSSVGLTRAQTLTVVEVVANWYLHATPSCLEEDVSEVAAAATAVLDGLTPTPWRTTAK